MQLSPICWITVAVAAVACRGPSGEADRAALQTKEAPATSTCRALHEAQPHQWAELMPAVLRAGAAAEAALIGLLEVTPSAAGAQASVAALAHIGGAPAVALCQRIVAERGPLAVEAALALGALPTTLGDRALLECLRDRYGDPTLRTAAACSLACHGEHTHSPAWIAAIVRAGTPTGRRDEEALGLRVKTRWARERYFVQRALSRLGHTDLLEALDTDASWPTLEALAPKVELRLREQPARGERRR